MNIQKAFIKQEEDVILPITRGELVLDASGEPALHSQEFAATDSVPGLLTPTEKTRIAQSLTAETPTDSHIVQVQKVVNDEVVNVYPTTLAEGVIVTKDGVSTTLTDILKPLMSMDTTPTKGSTQAVTSGGIWTNIENTVGAIYQTVTTI